MKKSTKAYYLDDAIVRAVKNKSEKLTKKEDRKVSESEIVNKILKKALVK